MARAECQAFSVLQMRAPSSSLTGEVLLYQAALRARGGHLALSPRADFHLIFFYWDSPASALLAVETNPLVLDQVGLLSLSPWFLF